MSPTNLNAPAPDILKLHSAYRDGQFFIWGEVNPHKSPARHLPFCEKTVRVNRAISHVADHPRFPAAFQRSSLWVPTLNGKPLALSASVAALPEAGPQARILPWTVSTAVLSAENAFQFLDSANRNIHAETWDTRLAPSTRFWGAALRLVAELGLRDRLLPSLALEAGRYHARWKPLLAAPDQVRLRQLAAAMPPVARAVTPLETDAPPEDDPAFLLASFVEWLMDVLPRAAGKSSRFPASPYRTAAKRLPEPPGLEASWLRSLRSQDSSVMSGNHETLEAFRQRIEHWQRPLLRESGFPWLLTFELQEPLESPREAPAGDAPPNAPGPDSWHVRYQFRSLYDESVLSPKEATPPRYAARLLARAAGICADIREDTSTFPLDVTGAFRFLTETAGALERQGFPVVVPEWWKRREQAGNISARPVVRPHEGRLSSTATPGMFSLSEFIKFDWEVAIGGENYTREELDHLAQSTAPLVKVHGHWLPLDPQSIRAALELWKREPMPARDVIRMTLSASLAPPGVRYPANIHFEDARGEGWIGDLLGKLGGHSRFEEFPTPETFQGTLRPYQLRGFSWLGFLRQYGLGACLADDMGLGKTIQALALLERERANGVTRPVLLICPTSVVGNWRKEAARFAPGLKVLVHHGVDRTRGDDFATRAADHALVISTYTLAHRDLEALQEVPWSGILLDEAQNIKNPETRQSRAVRSIAADYRIALTGTPVENSVGELWSIMDFLNPGFLGSQSDFRRRFLVPIQKRADSSAIAQLKKLTAPFILRRLKTDTSVIQDLPEKMEMKVFCNLTLEQAALYRGVVEETTRALDTPGGIAGIKRKGVILAALTRLKQVCNHPAQFLKDNSTLPGRSGKLSRLTEMVEELLAEGDRALIFTQFVEMGEKLQRHLADTFGEEVLFLHGGLPAAKRDEMVERFQSAENPGPRLFVLSLKAGGTGLNLTAANHVFHFDRWWNPAVENQATDRAFRIGQLRNVQIHKFVCLGTLEERIDEMIERKKAISGNVIGAGEAWLTELSTEELKQLFALRQEAVE